MKKKERNKKSMFIVNDHLQDERVLLVDDDADILCLVETVLRKEGFKNIFTASTGAMALKLCRVENPDIIVLDIMLPDMDGFEVCKKIREFSDVPILFLSAKSEEVDRLLSFAIGGDDYISKPFSPREVVYRIKARLKRSIASAGNSSICVIDDLEINKAEGIVKKNGEVLQLTAMEYKLLVYFVENRNIILSKERLIERVWGIDFIGTDNTLMVHVRHLREKIEKDARNPQHIQTVKKMGYRFVG